MVVGAGVVIVVVVVVVDVVAAVEVAAAVAAELTLVGERGVVCAPFVDGADVAGKVACWSSVVCS